MSASRLRRWWLKAAVQGAVAVLPDRLAQPLNARLQALGSGGAALAAQTLRAKLDQAAHHCAMWAVHGGGTAPSVLEIGTGWYPLVPFAMYLDGVATIDSFDIRPHTTPERIRLAAAAVVDARVPSDRKRTGRLRALAAAADVDVPLQLREMGITFRGGAVTASSVEPGAYDVAVSDNTLEHVPLRELRGLTAATYHALRPGGVADHFIDGSDHLAHFDRTISEYHFLRFEPWAWSLVNNRLVYQNRLREADYRREFEQAGFAIVGSDWKAGRSDDLARLRLAREFRRRPRADLAPLRGFTTVVRPAAG